MRHNTLGEGRERGILREASSGEAATSTDGLGVPRYVLVRDMNYPGEIMVGEWDGERYQLADGDCYSRERLADEYGAEFSDTPNLNYATGRHK